MISTKGFRLKVLDDQILDHLMIAIEFYEKGYEISYTHVYNADALVTYAYYCQDINYDVWFSMHKQLHNLALTMKLNLINEKY